MKNAIIIITFGIIVGLLCSIPAIHADSQVRKSYDFVIVQGYPDFRQTVDQSTGRASYSWNGCFVYNYSNSSNAPAMIVPQPGEGGLFPVGSRTNNLAQALADLSNQGFEVISFTGDSTSELTYVLKRLRVHP